MWKVEFTLLSLTHWRISVQGSEKLFLPPTPPRSGGSVDRQGKREREGRGADWLFRWGGGQSLVEGGEGVRMREFRLLSFSFPSLADGRRQRRSLEEEETGENRKQSATPHRSVLVIDLEGRNSFFQGFLIPMVQSVPIILDEPFSLQYKKEGAEIFNISNGKAYCIRVLNFKFNARPN